MEDKTLVMIKGPFLLGGNFGLVIEYFRFDAFSQTLSSFLKGMNFCRVRAAMTCWANSWAARASFRAAVRFLSLVSTTRMAELWMTGGKVWGSYPIMRKNGDWKVTECGQWLWINSAWNIDSVHEVGLSPQKIWR